MSTPETAGTARFAVPETFFQAQKRNRHATWRMSALAAVAALLMGIPLTLVLTPFLYAIALVVAEVVNHFWSLPPAFWEGTNYLARFVYHVADTAINQRGSLDPRELTIALVLVFLPGIVVALALWVGIGLLFRHGGVGGTLASLNARTPNPTDLKELQLADTVQEMAIAAGLPAPQVMLVDSPGANAAAVGTSPEDAHVVLSRRLLDDLDRGQLQALIGHLVASIGNGDLHIAFKVTTVFETCGLIVTLINAPFGKQSRSTLWRVIRYPFRRSDRKTVDADEVAELLADTMESGSSDIDRFFNSGRAGPIRKTLRLAFFPLMFTNAAVELTLWFFLHVLLGPCMALVWRTRRYLADAGAVELTRNPDALASALQRLSQDDTALAGGNWANHLFVVNPCGDRSLGGGAGLEQQRKALQAWRTAAGAGGIANTAAKLTSIQVDPAEYAAIRKEILTTVMAAARGDATATARMQAFVQAMGSWSALGLTGMPNPNDVLLAQRGDRAALSRLRMLRQSNPPPAQARHGRTGLQTYSFVSFHPPLNKREKRLQRIGAREITFTRRRKGLAGKIVLAVLWLIIGPLLVAAGLAVLATIVLMIGLNLLFLALWLSVIHWAFAQDWGQILQAFLGFVAQVAEAIRKSR